MCSALVRPSFECRALLGDVVRPVREVQDHGDRGRGELPADVRHDVTVVLGREGEIAALIDDAPIRECRAMPVRKFIAYLS